MCEPTLISYISHKSIVKVACGDDYSAAISGFGELFVTGCYNDGKLGLGDAYKQGYIMNFTMVPNLVHVKSVACGPHHMIAICDSG